MFSLLINAVILLLNCLVLILHIYMHYLSLRHYFLYLNIVWTFIRGRYRISRKRGGYGYFILGHFVAGHITRCMDNILGDKTSVKIASGGQNAGHFMEQGGQNANIIKTFYI